MSARVRTPQSRERSPSRPASSSQPHQSLALGTAGGGRGSPEGRASSAAPSAREQQMMDNLASLFTVQHERCVSRASRESTSLSRASLTSSQLALADATFIYQHVNFQVLSRCVPAFVKSHLNKNGRYLPESFILRVNYLRRRRALGEDSTAKRAAKAENAAKENAAKESAAKENAAKNTGDATSNQSRFSFAKSSRTQSVSSKQNSLSESRVTLISG